MQAIRSARTWLARTGRSYHKAVDHKQPHMDELPVPSGSWQATHDARNRKHNAILAVGIAFAGFSVFTAKASGVVYFNWSPPDSID